MLGPEGRRLGCAILAVDAAIHTPAAALIVLNRRHEAGGRFMTGHAL